MSEEIWKPIDSSGDYEVSNLGRVRSWRPVPSSKLTRRSKPLVMKQQTHKAGYKKVRVHGVGQYVHTLVLEAFVSLRPEGHVACHKDDVPDNNVVENLRWAPKRENAHDAMTNGSSSAKISENQVREIRIRFDNGESKSSIARSYGITSTAVYYIVKGITWSHVES
jgi:hypothetical protein